MRRISYMDSVRALEPTRRCFRMANANLKRRDLSEQRQRAPKPDYALEYCSPKTTYLRTFCSTISSPVIFLIVPSSIPCGKNVPTRPIFALVPLQIVAGGVFFKRSWTTCAAHLWIRKLAFDGRKGTRPDGRPVLGSLFSGICSQGILERNGSPQKAGLTVVPAYQHPPFCRCASHSRPLLWPAHRSNL